MIEKLIPSYPPEYLAPEHAYQAIPLTAILAKLNELIEVVNKALLCEHPGCTMTREHVHRKDGSRVEGW